MRAGEMFASPALELDLVFIFLPYFFQNFRKRVSDVEQMKSEPDHDARAQAGPTASYRDIHQGRLNHAYTGRLKFQKPSGGSTSVARTSAHPSGSLRCYFWHFRDLRFNSNNRLTFALRKPARSPPKERRLSLSFIQRHTVYLVVVKKDCAFQFRSRGGTPSLLLSRVALSKSVKNLFV